MLDYAWFDFIKRGKLLVYGDDPLGSRTIQGDKHVIKDDPHVRCPVNLVSSCLMSQDKPYVFLTTCVLVF